MPGLEKLDLASLQGAGAYIGIAHRNFAIRYGPYAPPTAVGFVERLMAGHEGPHPFIFTVTLDPIEDPVPDLLRMAADEGDARALAPPDRDETPAFDEPSLRIAVWNALRKAHVAQDSCYRLIDDAVADYRTFASRVTG
jgi:hypothetical protein